MTLIDRLEQFAAKATKGPWKRDPYSGTDMQIIAAGNEVVVYHRQHPRQNSLRLVENHELICALHSAFPYLIAAAKEAEASRRALVQTGSGEHVTLAWGTNGRQADKDLIEARTLTDAAKAQAEEQGNG